MSVNTRTKFTKELADHCKPKAGLKPGDELEWVITIQAGSQTPVTGTLCDVLPDDIFTEEQIIEVPIDLDCNETFELTVTGTLRDDLCEPCTFTNVAELKVDACHSEYAISETCVIGEECDLKYNPKWGMDEHRFAELFFGSNKAQQVKIVDWLNKCNTLLDLDKECPPVTLTPEIIDQICEIILAKLTQDNLKDVILACLEDTIDKDFLAAAIQGA